MTTKTQRIAKELSPRACLYKRNLKRKSTLAEERFKLILRKYKIP